MFLVLTKDDLDGLKPTTRAELLATFFAEPANAERFPPNSDGFAWDGRVDLDDDMVRAFMDGCAPETVEGLRIIAEEGPIIAADELKKVGIDNYGHFQSRTTKRVRTVTGGKDAYLLAWDDWRSEDNQQYGCGHYAVTMRTHQALMRYFDL